MHVRSSVYRYAGELAGCLLLVAVAIAMTSSFDHEDVAEAHLDLGGNNGYLWDSNCSFRKDPINIVFAGSASVDEVLTHFDDHLHWPTISVAHASLYFPRHDGPCSEQDRDRATFGFTDSHVRFEGGYDGDSRYGNYVLAAAHRDIGFPHAGVDFNETRDAIVAAFQGEHHIEYFDVGNSASACSPQAVGDPICDSSDGLVAAIWINPPPTPTLAPCTESAAFLNQYAPSSVSTGQTFSVFFEVRNNGSCTWTEPAYYLSNLQNPLGASSTQPLGQSVVPAGIKRWDISMTAPSTPGTYRTQWTLKHNGQSFGPNMFLDITVTQGTSNGDPKLWCQGRSWNVVMREHDTQDYTPDWRNEQGVGCKGFDNGSVNDFGSVQLSNGINANGVISAIAVAPGHSARLCWDANEGGKCHPYTGTTDFIGWDFDNQPSSLYINGAHFGSSDAKLWCQGHAWNIVIREHDTQDYTPDWRNEQGVGCRGFDNGSVNDFGSLQLSNGINANGVISAIAVGQGHSARLCWDANEGGKCHPYTGITDFIGWDFDNQPSSLYIDGAHYQHDDPPTPTPALAPTSTETPVSTETPTSTATPTLTPTPTGTETPPDTPTPSGSNDNFADAWLIPAFPFEGAQNTDGMTTEPGEPLNPGGCISYDPYEMGSTVWYRFTVPKSGKVSAATSGSSFDTVLAAYTGFSIGLLSSLACNDDINVDNDRQSNISFPVAEGATYYLQVGGYADWSGNLLLHVSLVSGPTATPTRTTTPTRTSTQTRTPTPGGPTNTPTATRTATATRPLPPTFTPTRTRTPTMPPTATRTPTRTPTPRPLMGDVTCDRRIDAFDAQWVLWLTARIVGSLPCGQSADVNHDGVTNSLDVALILQYVAGLLPRLPV